MNKVLLVFLSFFIIPSSFATVYYSQVSVGGGRDVTQLSSWKTSVGGGTSPVSFLAGDEFHVVNSDSMIASAAWIIPGVRLVIENGKFKNSAFSHSFTLDMLAAGYYYHTGSSYNNVIFGALDSESSFEFRGGTFIASRTYPNLIFNIPVSLPINGNPVVLGSLSSIGNGYLIFAYSTASSIVIAKDLNILKGQFTSVFGNYNSTVSVGGNFNISNATVSLSKGAGICSMSVSGNVNLSSGNLTLSTNSTGTGAVALSISGNVNMTGGTFIGVSNGATASPVLSVMGNCTIGSNYYAQNGGTTTGVMNYMLSGSGSFSIASATNYNHNVTVTGNYTLGSNILIGKDLVINGGNLIISNKTLSLYNALNITSGTLTGSTSSNLSILSSSLDVNLPSITLNTLLISRSGQTVSMTGDVIVDFSLNIAAGTLSIGAHTLTCNRSISGAGTLLGGATSSLILTGTSGFNLAAITLKRLTFNRSGQSLTLAGPVSIVDSLVTTNGNINNSSQTLTIGDGATIVRDNGIFTAAPAFAGNYNLSYTGTSAVTIGNEFSTVSPNILDNLSISKTGGVNLNKNIEVNQTITINSGGVLNSSFYTIQADGNWVNNGTFNPGTGTVNFYGNSGISGSPTGGHNFNNISIGSGATLSGPASSNVNVSNNFITGATSIFNHNNGTFTFSGAGSQTIPALNFYNLSSTSTGSRTLSGSGIIGIAGIFTPGTNTYSNSGSTVNFNGSLAQNIPAFTFNNLTVSGTSVKTLSPGNITVNGILTFSNAVISTGLNKVIIGAAGSVTGSGSGNYVNGNLQKNFSIGSGVSRTFEIGNASSYLPITATFATVSVAGSITANTTDNDHAQIASSCIDGTKSVNRYWTLSNSGVSPVNYGVIPNFIAGDVDGGANFNNFEGVLYNGSSWQNLVSGTKTSTSISLSGATTFGSFQIGEPNTLVSVSIGTNPGTTICTGTSVTFTATPVNGGPSPTYQWKKNNVNVGIGNTYADNTLVDSDIISVDMVSNSPCAFHPNATNFVTMTVNTAATPTITPDGTTTFCVGGNVTLTSSPGVSYLWSTGATTSSIVVSTTGSYSVTITDVNGCQATSNGTVVTVNPCAFTWNGSADTDWNNGSNWDTGLAPDSTGNATIPSGMPNMPVITSTAATRFITINSGATLMLNAANTLKVFGDLINNGIFTDNGGTTVFKGNSAQAITGVTSFKNMTVNNASGLTLNNAVTVTGVLSLLNGMLTTNGNLIVDLNTGTVAYNTTDLGSVSGDMQVKKNVVGSGTHFVGCPLSGVTANDMNDDTPVLNGGGTRLYTWNGTTASYSGIFNLSTPLVVNTGYNLFFTVSSTVLDFTGSYNHAASPYSITASHADSVNILVGNPYPSALDWDAASGWTKTNIADAVAYYNPTQKKYAYYINGVGSNGGTQYVPALNAFWVKRSSSGSATIGLDNRTRVSNVTPSLWRKGTLTNCLKITAGIDGLDDEALIRFDEEATDHYDNHFDAFKLINPDSTPSVYTADIHNTYSINTLPVGNKVIALNLKAAYSGIHTIVIEGSDSFDAPCQVFLEDKLLNVRKEIIGKTSYNCNVNTDDKVDRFNLRVSYNINTTNNNTNNKVFIGSYDKTVNFTFNNAGNVASLSIYNLMGQSVGSVENADISSGIYSYSNAKLLEGIYVVKVSIGNDIYTSKVYIK